MLREVDFAFFQKLLKDQSGLNLTPDKAYLVTTRMRPILEDHGFDSITALVQHLRVNRKSPVAEQVVEAMTTNESLWFRDNSPFVALSKMMLPSLLKSRKGAKPIRIWCAAASTGQEPYSIAIVLDEAGAQLRDRSVEIIGTDLSQAALRRARMGTYTSFEIGRGLGADRLQRYFKKAEGGRYAIAPQIRSKVRFEYRNLLAPFTGLGTFDIIFCRNVLIYFDRPTKADVLNRMAEILSDDGYLVLGGPETTLGISDAFKREPEWRNVYIRNTRVDARRLAKERLVA